MVCPKCGSDQMLVYDSRPDGQNVMRRRECLVCRHKFKTVEIPDEDYKMFKKYVICVRGIRDALGRLAHE